MNILIHSFIKIFCGVAASDTNIYSKIKAIINRQVLVKSKKKDEWVRISHQSSFLILYE